MTEAASEGLAVVARGAGTKIDWGRDPEHLDLVVDVSGLDGTVEHLAGDLVARVGAGVRVAELGALLARSGQRLTIDEMVGGSTIGGVIATGLCGPRRLGYGSVRDLLLGVTVVRADGVLARSGGRVVKNVAGYDLSKLYTGSYGTLGIIAEAFFRLHPLPGASRWIGASYADGRALAPPIAAVLGSQVVPAAVEVNRAGPDGRVEVSVLVEGGRRGVDTRSARVAEMLGPAAVVDPGPPSWWGTLPGSTTVKLSLELATVPSVLDAVAALSGDTGVEMTLRGSAGAGVVYVGSEVDEPGRLIEVVDRLRSLVRAVGGYAVVLRTTTPVRSVLDIWGPAPALELMRRVKEQWDPDRRLAPGRFVGGI